MLTRPSDRHCSQVKRTVKEELLKPRYRDAAVDSVIEEVLSTQGLEAQIRNSIYLQNLHERSRTGGACGLASDHAADASSAGGGGTEVRRSSLRAVNDELDAVVELRLRWGRMLLQNLRKLCEEASQPLMRTRATAESEKWRSKRMPQKCSFLYEASDLVDAVAQPHSNGSEEVRLPAWGISPIRVRTPTLQQLRARFADLALQERQTGVDDELRGWFDDERIEEGQRILANGYTPLLEKYATRGVPSGLRARVWLGLLHLQLGEREYSHFSDLQSEVTRVLLLTDELQKRDAAAPHLEDQYFVFVAMVEEILLCFSRDSQVYQLSKHPQHSTLVARGRDGRHVPFPPSGVPPFRGQSQYAFPLCFVYAQPQQLYYVYRALWMRFWSKLHSFSSRPRTLLTLCLLFEELMQDNLTDVCTHLMHLDVHPTAIALPWIISGFAAVLPADQTLLLWDRVLGFDALELLPVLAVAIFSYRTKWILQATNAERVQRIMSNLSSLKVVPLLQTFLGDAESLTSRQKN